MCSGQLSPERKHRLDEIASDWLAPRSYFDTCYNAAEDYYREHKNLLVPANYMTTDGIKLSQWVSALRKRCRKGELGEEQIERLNMIGMDWRNQKELKQEPYFEALSQWVREHGDTNVPKSYVAENGLQLGKWLYEQKKAAANGKLKPERKKRLDSLNPAWVKPKAQRRLSEKDYARGAASAP